MALVGMDNPPSHCHNRLNNLTRDYLGAHFNRTALIPVVSDICCLEGVVEQEKPDIVIHEIVERKLIKVPSD